MRHFEHFTPEITRELFEREPEHLDGLATALEVGAWLGATLYVPGSRPNLVADVLRQRRLGVVAVVVDFEDSLPDSRAGDAASIATDLIDGLGSQTVDLPLVFLRMRSAGDLVDAIERTAGDATGLAGFVFPKFDPLAGGEEWLDAIAVASSRVGRQLLGMPIIESPGFAYLETRAALLAATRDLISRKPNGIACIRIGGTDLASVFGLRRTADTTVYDIKLVADVIADVSNVFARALPTSIPVSGPVWEHFSSHVRLNKPRLRETPFALHDTTSMRRALVGEGLDMLLSEINLDKLNGLVGKTVIHPSHVALVHSLSVVSHEEYEDARSIIERELDGGVMRSPSGNKMNEVRPHTAWARRVVVRARVFGVARSHVDFVDFLVASGNAAP